MKDAARQVEAAQRNILADYGELYQLRKDVKTLIENNDGLKSTLGTMLDQLANPSFRSKIFAIADALAGGTPTLDNNSRLALLQILEDCYQRKSVIVTSQLPVAKWYDYINEPTLADAIMDRLLANASRIELKGESMRRKTKK